MAELHQTPSAAQEAARATIKAREQAIDANGVKRGRALERAEILTKLGVQSIEDASQVAQLRQERDARPTQEQLKEARNAGRGQGRAEGLTVMFVLCGIGASLFALNLVGGTLDRAVPMRAQQTIADQVEAERELEQRLRAP